MDTPIRRFLSITVPDGWNARLWGRTGCRFDVGGRGLCVTGDCGGLYQCRGWGAGGCDYHITFGVTPPAVGGPPG